MERTIRWISRRLRAVADGIARRLDPQRSIAIRSLPCRITRSGAYHVVRDLMGVPGASGITLEVEGVTIDLRGHALVGVPGSLAGIDAVGVPRVVVQNGTLRAWGDVALALGPRPCVRDLVVRD